MGFYTFQECCQSPNFKPSLMVETVPEPPAASGLFAGGALLAWLDRRRARGFPLCTRRSS
jgi:hypothetical protein